MTKDTSCPENESPVDVLSALLDFYSDRASSFASLFVASIFGLVTLSAIIQAQLGNNLSWYYISMVPYFGFVLSAYYTWCRFRYWADIAHSIEQYGLRDPFRLKIEKINFLIKEEGENKNVNLYDFINRKYSSQKKNPIRWLLGQSNWVFYILFMFLIACLTIITYWDLPL